MKSLFIAAGLCSICASSAFAGAGDGTVEGNTYGDAKGKGEWAKAEPPEVGIGSNHVSLQSTASGNVGFDVRYRPKPGVKGVKEIEVYYRSNNYTDRVSLMVVCQTSHGDELRRNVDLLSNKKVGNYLVATVSAEKLGLAKGDQIKRVFVNHESVRANGAGNAVGALVIKTESGTVKPEDVQLKIGHGLFNWQEK